MWNCLLAAINGFLKTNGLKFLFKKIKKTAWLNNNHIRLV